MTAAPVAASSPSVEDGARSTLRRLLRVRRGVVGATMVLAVTLVLVIGPLFAPYAPTSIGTGIPSSGPDVEHLLGTDDLGRDVLSRFLSGGIGIVLIPTASVLLAFLIGGTAGATAGYVGGRFDRVVTAIIGILLPIPSLLIALLLVTRFGSGVTSLIVVVGLLFAPRIARVARGAVQSIRGFEYVVHAEMIGQPTRRILRHELLPNVAGPLLVEFGIRLNFAVVFVAALNFLGLAAQPPSSTWGLMIAEGRNLLPINPWVSLAPALALAVMVIGFNLLTDAIAEIIGRELVR
jgi:peptide/nickel transport system permease protein